MPDLPTRLYRVEAEVGYGYPEPYKRERQRRNFARAQSAADWIANLERWPFHHRVVGVYVTDCDWTELARDALPPPTERTEDAED